MNIDDLMVDSEETWYFDPKKQPSKKDLEAMYSALALAGEAGELANVIKKTFRKKYLTDGHAIENEKELVASEIADVLYYTARIADTLDIDLTEAWKKKMDINRQRYNK